MSQPMHLYSWPTPNGWKISIMLEECGLPYVFHPVNISQGEQFKPEFLALSPNNRIPALVDPEGPDGAPLSVFESGAILQYLGRKTAQFYPSSERERVAVDQWLFWQVGGFGPMLGQNHHFRHYAPETVPYGIERYTKETARLYGVLDKQLIGRDYITGDFSIADISCVGWASVWERQGVDLADYPHVKAWLERCLQRQGVQRGLALGSDLRK